MLHDDDRVRDPVLRSSLDRPVVEPTGLTDRYDFELEFVARESLWDGQLPRSEPSEKQRLLQAIHEQLGTETGVHARSG
jgi:uncharacterized protein (TIGR03435 family)